MKGWQRAVLWAAVLIIPVSLFTAYSFRYTRKFEVPDPGDRLAAIGDVSHLPESALRAYIPGNDFIPMGEPEPGDWLYTQVEIGQTFDGFLRSKPNLPDAKRRFIYLRQLGEFPEFPFPVLQRLSEFTAAYFTIETTISPRINLDKNRLTTRSNPISEKYQFLAPELLKLLKKQLPKDAYCLMGLTMDDLYPDPAWNFVFGQASLRDRTGVYSFCRFDPLWYGSDRKETFESKFTMEICRLLAHEMSHMFGIQHCIYFKCVMNGAMSLREHEEQPIHLCPVCLRKLQHSTGCDVLARYHELLSLYQKYGLTEEAQWIEKRLEKLTVR